MSKPIFTNKDTGTRIQLGGPGNAFMLMPCTAITGWSRDFEETAHIKCKSAYEYGKKEIVATIPGSKGQPTFDVVAYTGRETDILLGLECPIDFQLSFGMCSTPNDPMGYTKIRHFVNASPTSEGEDNIDFIGDEAYEGIQTKVSFTCEDIVTILKATVRKSSGAITETEGFNDVAVLSDGRCHGECGPAINKGQYAVAVANASYEQTTATVWYSKDGGATWTICATDPFADNTANISSCALLRGQKLPRIVVARGNVSTTYGARFSVSDDLGNTWTEVNVDNLPSTYYVNAIFRHGEGSLWAVGNEGRVYFSEDRGTSWKIYSSTNTGVSVELYDIHTIDGDIVWAVGKENTVILSTDGGETWTVLSGPASSSAYSLYTVQVADRYRVLVGGQVDGNRNVLWATNDGGESWHSLTFTGSTQANGAVRRLRQAKPAIKQHFVLLHGVENAEGRYGSGENFRFLRTLDGGATWERLNLIVNNGLNGLGVIDVNTALAVGEVTGDFAVVQKMAI